jgi:hypothetical protein
MTLGMIPMRLPTLIAVSGVSAAVSLAGRKR